MHKLLCLPESFGLPQASQMSAFFAMFSPFSPFVTCDVLVRYFFVAFPWPSSAWKNSVWASFVAFS